MLNSKQRSKLRALANKEEAVVIVGKDGITKESIQSMEDVLRKRELIKVKVLDTAGINVKEGAHEAANSLHADCVQVVGSVFVLFRKKDKESKFDMI